MKTLHKVMVTAAFATFFSSAVFAEGSRIEGSTLINASNNSKNLSLAIGRNSAVNTGSIRVQGSEVKGSTIINASNNSKNLGLAIGRDSTVNTGSTDIK